MHGHRLPAIVRDDFRQWCSPEFERAPATHPIGEARQSKHIDNRALKDRRPALDTLLTSVGRYMTDREYKGVWVSDRVLDANEGASFDTIILTMDLPADVFKKYEWVEDFKS